MIYQINHFHFKRSQTSNSHQIEGSVSRKNSFDTFHQNLHYTNIFSILNREK